MLHKPNTKNADGNYLPEYFEFDNLYIAGKQCCRNVRWKPSVSYYELNLLNNTAKLINELNNGTYKLSPYAEFTIHEPKDRNILATKIRDRQIQRALCNGYLYNALTKSFIYDNVACQVDKGTDFANDRMKGFLVDFYNKNRSNDGYVLKADIHHFFESIDHDVLKAMLLNILKDDKLAQDIVFEIIDSFGNKGLGLGSQVSQLLALVYLNPLDHIIKEQFKFKRYIRYMDDFVIISENKEDLVNFLKYLKEYLYTIKLELNSKTYIQPLRKGFNFLQWHYFMTETGKVIKEPYTKSIHKKKRKLTRLIRKHKKGELSLAQLTQSFNSMIHHLSKGNSFYAINSLYIILSKHGITLIQ